MQVVDPGHGFKLKNLDSTPDSEYEMLIYVKREGINYPGNVGHYPGTTMQEICRAQISRAFYVNNQIPSEETRFFIKLQRESILALERRAAQRHGRVLKNVREDIENESVCFKCGHIQCEGTCH